MTRSTACRFFQQGRCNKGSSCSFYHGPSEVEVCRYFERGFCAAGENCRFRHPEELQTSDSSPPFCEDLASVEKDCDDELLPCSPARDLWCWREDSLDANHWVLESEAAEDSAVDYQEFALDADPYNQEEWELWAVTQDGLEWKDRSICPAFLANGRCPAWRRCQYPHGNFCEPDLLQLCGKWSLHPYNEAKRLRHTEFCAQVADRAKSRQVSAEQECCICLELVMQKPPGDRQFGLLSCDHVCCLRCVRGWRANIASGADVDTALRCCPICRQITHFVTPSKLWPRTPEEKERIVEQYKARLATIDCKYWERGLPGDKRCPFGTSCFYRHKGAEDMPAPRKFMTADGQVKYGNPVHLSDFLISDSFP